jgi:hypothetical protein
MKARSYAGWWRSTLGSAVALAASILGLALGCSGDAAETHGGTGARDAGAGAEGGGGQGGSHQPPGGGGGSGGGAGGETPSTWRSSLYPEDWTPEAAPDAEGRFLHDFSYAGYHAGEVDPPAQAPGATFDVTGFGADPSGTADATSAFDAAIAAASAGGGVVFAPAGTYRIDGVLEVAASGVVLRGEGPSLTMLIFTRSDGLDFDAHLTIRGGVAAGPDAPLAEDGESRASEVFVADAAGLAPGDAVAVGWVITDAWIAEHGMTGTWTISNGQWRPFFRRTVVAIDASTSPVRVELDVPLRYPAKTRDGASVRKETGYVTESAIEHLAVANAVAWDEANGHDQVHAIALRDAADCWVRDVRSVPSPYATGASDDDDVAYHLQSSGILVEGSKRITIAETSMELSQHRGSGGNGYLFEVSRSNEVLFVDVAANAGRHNLIQNWDFGTSGCVFLRCSTANGGGTEFGFPTPAFSEYHHSLAMANLVDSSTVSDGFRAVNRGAESSGAGHSSTQSVLWNARGGGYLASKQFGWGYVIGTRDGMLIDTALDGLLGDGVGTEPADFVEGEEQGADLEPQSLYEDQLARRLRR